jgi:hypothetical protein
MHSLQQKLMVAHHNSCLLHQAFVLFFMFPVQVSGAEVLFAVIAEEVSTPVCGTKATHNFSDFLLNFECLLDLKVPLHYARI